MHAKMHICMNARTHSCLLSRLAKEAQWSMCSLRQRGREGGSQAVPSSWVIFNQQYYHASQKDLHSSHPPPKKSLCLTSCLAQTVLGSLHHFIPLIPFSSYQYILTAPQKIGATVSNTAPQQPTRQVNQ